MCSRDVFALITLTYDSFRLALGSLRSNKLRTFLTLLGIIVGVTSVIAVMTIISGLDQTVSNAFSSQGSTVFSVAKRPLVITSRDDFVKYNHRKDVSRDDAEAIMRGCHLCWRTGMAVNGSALVKHGDNRSESVPLRGLTLSMFDIENVTIQAGRVWTDQEGGAGHNVCVIGTDFLDNLYNGASPDSVIGSEIRIDGVPYKVLGVAAPFGKVLGFSRDNFVYIPFQTSQKMFGSRDSITVHIQVRDASEFESAKDEVSSIMRIRRGRSSTDDDPGFSVESQDAFISIYSNATSGIYIATIAVAAISLVVGGIVVMNIMLVSVTERTKEIGLRKSVGATQRNILLQFLIEAITITAAGGAIGVGTGYALAYLLSVAMGFPVLIQIKSAVLGVTVSLIVGLFSGLYPAWRAARLDPIEAMRRE